MASLDEERLRQMGVDTKVGNFLLYDNNWVQFFEWMLANTTDDNIYTDMELNEITAMREQDLILSGCEVEDALLDLNQQYPGILNYTATDQTYATNKLKNLCRLELFYRDHYRQCVTLIDRLEMEVSQLELELQDKVAEERRMLQVVTDQAVYLEETKERKKCSFAEMQRFVNDKNPCVPVFMHQMPLQNFNDSVSLFLKHVDIFVTKNFGAAEHTKSDVVQARIDDLKGKWAAVEDQYLETKLDVVGRANIVEKFLKRPIDTMYEPKLAAHVQELCCRNSTMDAEFDALLFENQTLLKKAIQSECDLMLFKRHEAKRSRALQQYELLSYIRGVVSNVLSEEELIWVMMKIDLEKLNTHMKSIQGVVAGDYESTSDHSALAVVSKRNVKHPVERFEKEVLDLQKRYLTDNFFMSRNIFEITEEIHRSVGESYVNIKSAKFLQNFFQEYSRLIKLDDALSRYVLDGSMTRPYLINHPVMLLITQKQQHRDCTQKRIRRMMQVFETNYVCRWKQDELWAAKQMLWVWFMMDRRRALMALNEVTRMAKTTPAYAKFNPTFELMKYN